MGCDVHIHSEIKVGGKWLHYDQPRAQRNYTLFEKMAGVRGKEENAMAAPRGLPDDATETTRFDSEHWNGDGHSHSWLNAEEIRKLGDWYREEFKGRDPDSIWPKWDQWLFGNCYSDFMRYPDDRPKGVEDVRFIFWFDN